MHHKLVRVLLGAVLLILLGAGIGKLAKARTNRSISGTLVSSQGKVRLSPKEARDFQKNMPVLPGNQGYKTGSGPGSVQREMQTINEIQRINEMNKRNSR